MASIYESELYQLQFLAGLTAVDLWVLINPIILPSWACLMLAPRWKHTKSITFLLPLFHAFLYLLVGLSLLTRDDAEEVDFLKFDDIAHAFQNPNTTFFAWIHIVCFDVLIGRMILLDSKERGASLKFHYCVMVPVLGMTMMFAPVGWLLYNVIAAVALSPAKTPKQKES